MTTFFFSSQYHVKNDCSSRESFDLFKYQVASGSAPKLEVNRPPVLESEESWDHVSGMCLFIFKRKWFRLNMVLCADVENCFNSIFISFSISV